MEGKQENLALGQGKISRLLLKFSVPCIMGLLISALYNIVDQIFIGNSELGYLGNPRDLHCKRLCLVCGRWRRILSEHLRRP